MKNTEKNEICNKIYDELNISVYFGNPACEISGKSKMTYIPIYGYEEKKGFYHYTLDYVDNCMVDDIEYIEFYSLKLKDKVKLLDFYIRNLLIKNLNSEYYNGSLWKVSKKNQKTKKLFALLKDGYLYFYTSIKLKFECKFLCEAKAAYLNEENEIYKFEINNLEFIKTNNTNLLIKLNEVNRTNTQ